MSWEVVPKGNSASISQNQFVVGLGWDSNPQYGAANVDLDVAAFMVTPAGKMRIPTDLVYYANLRSACGSVVHLGDARTGDETQGGDDEQLVMNLSTVPHEYGKIIIAVQIHQGAQKGQNFHMVQNCYVRLFVPQNFAMTGQKLQPGRPMLRFDLGQMPSNDTACVFCELYRTGTNQWSFKAVQKMFAGDFNSLMQLLRPH